MDQFPPEDMALREKLPEFKPQTRDGLIGWAEVQPGALPWLLKRAAKYWEYLPLTQRSTDAGSLCCDATAALDLLRWRIEAKDDRAAVQHLQEESLVGLKVVSSKLKVQTTTA